MRGNQSRTGGIELVFPYEELSIVVSTMNQSVNGFPTGKFEALTGICPDEAWSILRGLRDILSQMYRERDGLELPTSPVVRLSPFEVIVVCSSMASAINHLHPAAFKTRTGFEFATASRVLSDLAAFRDKIWR